MLHLERSRRGSLSAKIRNQWLHSPYAPEREADRFLLHSLKGRPLPDKVLILGTGLGYLHQALKRRYSHLPCLSISYSQELRQAALKEGILTPGDTLFPADITQQTHPLRHFLEDSLPGDIKILTWNPAAQAFRQLHDTMSRTITEILKQNHSSLLTTGYFGYRWLRNFIINYLTFPTSPQYPNITPRSAPLIIAASGPTLESHLSNLTAHREEINLWALPSSLGALRQAGIRPDAVLSTDPGFYAGYHYTEISSYKDPPPLLMPLTAQPFSSDCLPRQYHKRIQRFPLSQGTQLENYFFQNTPITTIPENGTVAGSALHLADKIAPRQLIAFCGLDFCWLDIQEHARPHPFDSLAAQHQYRTSPLPTLGFQRVSQLGVSRLDTHPKSDWEGLPAWRTSQSMDRYRAWFVSRLPDFPRVKSLSPSSPAAEGLPDITWKELLHHPVTPAAFSSPPSVPHLPQFKQRQQQVLHFLNRVHPSSASCHASLPREFQWIEQWLALPEQLRLQGTEQEASSGTACISELRESGQVRLEIQKTLCRRIDRLIQTTHNLGEMSYAVS